MLKVARLLCIKVAFFVVCSVTCSSAKEVLLTTDGLIKNDSVPLEYATVIPAGMLYGSFTKESSPYRIDGSIIVPAGEKLEFGPGCKVFIGGNYSTITVFGQMIVKGTILEPVIFRSAKTNPDPWDWDRIYCRSRVRSIFENCVFEHANYGVYVENGTASFEGCEFRSNSLTGLVVRNAEVSLQKCKFYKGHVSALLLLAGAKMSADSLVVFNNTTAIACAAQSDCKLNGGSIRDNGTGIVMEQETRLTIVGADIIKNGKGVVASVEWPKKNREMVYDNLIDMVVETPTRLSQLVKQPEMVHSVSLPKSSGSISVAEDFTPSFSALAQMREQTVSFMGNVTSGVRYFRARSANADGTLQTRYPEGAGNLTGFQPELQVFTSGRQNNADINLLLDLYGNQWVDLPLHMRKNIFNLTANYQTQHLVVGDFFINGSETSIAGRKLTGFQYSGEFLSIGRGSHLLSFTLAGGETEVPKDSGRHDLSLYGVTVDSGMSMRQQLTYVAGVAIRPSLISTINVKGIIAKDQTQNPLFRPVITDPLAPVPMRAQTGCIDATVNLFSGALTLSTELDMGTHDTLDTSLTGDANKVAWYNPEINKAIPAVFGSIGGGKNYAFSCNAAGTYKGNALTATYMAIGPAYFSAGNPYLEADRRVITLANEKQLNEDISSAANFSYERRSKSSEFNLENGIESPVDRNSLSASAERVQKGRFPALSLEYTGVFETNTARENFIPLGDSVESFQKITNSSFDNQIGVEAKQKFDNAMDYSLKYQLLINNELTNFVDTEKNNLGDGTQHQVTARYSFRIQKVFKNRVSVRVATKSEKRNSFSGLSYKISNQSTIAIIPRILSLDINGEFSNKIDAELNDSNMVTQTQTRFYGIEAQTKYNISPKTSLLLLVRYEKSADETIGSTDNYAVPMGGIHLTWLF